MEEGFCCVCCSVPFVRVPEQFERFAECQYINHIIKLQVVPSILIELFVWENRLFADSLFETRLRSGCGEEYDGLRRRQVPGPSAHADGQPPVPSAGRHPRASH